MVTKRKPGFLSTDPGVQDEDQMPVPTTVVVDPSMGRPMVAVRTNQCTAHRKNGERCRKSSIKGARVCRSHGGAAPQVQRAARTRLLMASDDLMKALLKIALSGEEEGTRLRAVMGALDRAGFGTKAELDVTHSLKPYEEILQGMVFGTIQRGPAPDEDPAESAALDAYNATTDDDVLDVEVVEDPDEEPRPDPTPKSSPMEMLDWDDPKAYGGSGRRRRGTSFRRG